MIKNKIKITTKDIALMGVLLAIIEIVKFALGFIAGVELVTLLLIIYTLYFKEKMLYMLTSFLLVEGVLNGFSIWWVMYIYIWTILILITYLFRNNDNVLFWSIVSGLFGLSFGLLCCPIYIVIMGLDTAIAWWISGITTDIIHCICNFISCMVLFVPLKRVLNKIRL